MHFFLFFISFSTIFANPVPVSLSNGEPSSNGFDNPTTIDLGNPETPLTSQDSVVYTGNEDRTLSTAINQGNTPIAFNNQDSEPSSPLALVGINNPGDQSNSPQEQSGTGSQDSQPETPSDQSKTGSLESDKTGQESSNTNQIDTPNLDVSAGSQDLVALTDLGNLNNNQATDAEGCIPASASDSNKLKSRENLKPCVGQLAQFPIPLEVIPEMLNPLIKMPGVPAVGAPGTETPQSIPRKSPKYTPPTTPWPHPDSPIRTPVDENTCGAGWLTLCCSGIMKWARPNGVTNVFSAMYPNLAPKAEYDIDACIDYNERDSIHRCDHDGSVTCCQKKEPYIGEKPYERILKDESKGMNCFYAFPGAPDNWPGKFKPKKRPYINPPIKPPKIPKKTPPKRYNPDDYP